MSNRTIIICLAVRSALNIDGGKHKDTKKRQNTCIIGYYLFLLYLLLSVMIFCCSMNAGSGLGLEPELGAQP